MSKSKPQPERWVVHESGAYSNDPSSYKSVSTRAEVEAMLPDYGWMSNPGLYVYRVLPGTDVEKYILDLSSKPDPYPDFLVAFGPKSGIRWEHC